MSVFLGLPVTNDYQQVTLEELREVAAKRKLKISEKDEQDYLALLRAADLAISHVDSLPPYIDPRLLPEPDGSQDMVKARLFWKPSPDENPLNAWSHKCNILLPDVNGPLSGRSVAIKDNMSVAGLPITLGTFPEFLSTDGKFPVSEIDASVVKRVLEAGGHVAGTATCENYSACGLSYTAATGPVENPWATGHATGGSSSGCAALLAAAMKKKLALQQTNTSNNTTDIQWDSGIDLAIGGDQGGSIRLPAAYSGIYGLKPTHGLCPYTGIASLHPMMDHCGPMATSVGDIALLLSVLAGYDGLDPRMSPETPLRKDVKDYRKILEARIEAMKGKGSWTPSKAGSGLKVAILKEAWEVPTLSDEMAFITRAAAKRFASLGAQVDEVSIPMHTDGALIWTAATRAQMASFGTANAAPTSLSYSLPSLKPPPLTQRWLDLLSHHNPAMANVVFSSDYLSSKYPAVTASKAHAHVLQLRAAYDAVLEEYDVLITPVTPTVAPPHPPAGFGVMDRIMVAAGNTANTCPFNVTGHPGLSMPVGWGSMLDEAGTDAKRLPVGLQILGKRWDEETVLYAASVWEVGGLGLKSNYVS